MIAAGKQWVTFGSLLRYSIILTHNQPVQNMDHHYYLIDTVVISLVLAFICGMGARKLGIPAIIGYIAAGVMVGPFTPGFVADFSIAKQLAELGIILLMFGVGMHFSIEDLLDVRKIALPGALFQMFAATLIGTVTAILIGESWIEGVLFGFSLSVASTIVLLRALEQRHEVDTPSGKLAIGWLIVEDIAMILALVMLPVLADLASNSQEVSFGKVMYEITGALLKVGGFMVLMVLLGRRFLPWLLQAIARTNSGELITLGTLAIALGFAYIAYAAFDASFALGAFFAGLVLSESQVGHEAAEKSLPMRDAFAVLFFVSVGMLFDPMTLLENPAMVAMTVVIVIAGKAFAALLIASFFKLPPREGYSIAISLAQIGEFSFIFAGIALANGLLSNDFYNYILAGAIFSIAINPFLFIWLDKRIPPEPAISA